MARKTQDYVCIACPIGCPLQLVHRGDTIEEISGNNCKRGAKYARQEFTDPRRSFSTTIPIEGALYPRLPVKLSAPIRKEDILAAARAIRGLSTSAPIARGEVVLANLLGEESVNVVACRTMKLMTAPAESWRERQDEP
jgi:CxxC motif-containing protein